MDNLKPTDDADRPKLNDLSATYNQRASKDLQLIVRRQDQRISDPDNHKLCGTLPNITCNSDAKWRNELFKIVYCKQSQCHMCDGYYGNNHAQPICTTCHLFLFAEPTLDDDFDGNGNQRANSSVKAESEDSGTEEPLELDDEDGNNELSRELLGFTSIGVDNQRPIVNIPCEPRTFTAPIDGASAIHAHNLNSDHLRQRIRDLSEYVCDTNPSGLVQDFPPEVLLQVFSYLSDMSLYSVSNVCQKWRGIIDSEVTNEQWEVNVKRRWPLFKPHFRVDFWKDIYSQLIASAPCLYCIDNMKLMDTPPICEKSWRHRRLTSELRTLQQDPPEGILAVPLDKQCSFWQAMITGPRGTPYDGGKFYLYLQIPHSYPLKPPFVQFITKIFHPNVSRHGDIGLDSIHHNWSLALTISKILLSIQSLLTDPYIKVSMEPAIARCYHEDRELYNTIAKDWTRRYATTDRQLVHYGLVDQKGFFRTCTSHAL